MKLFTDCKGTCYLCNSSGSCLSGHGDDDFVLAPKQKLEEKLKYCYERFYAGDDPDHFGTIIATIENHFKTGSIKEVYFRLHNVKPIDIPDEILKPIRTDMAGMLRREKK